MSSLFFIHWNILLQVVSMTNDATSPIANTPGVELAQTEQLESSVSTEETVYTSGIPGTLDDENLIQVSVSRTPASAITNPTGMHVCHLDPHLIVTFFFFFFFFRSDVVVRWNETIVFTVDAGWWRLRVRRGGASAGKEIPTH